MSKSVKALSAVIALVVVVSQQAHSRELVKELTRIKDVSTSSGQIYSQMRISCVGEDQPRYIFRKSGQFKWCLSPDGSECRRNKVAVAVKACDAASDVAVTKPLSESNVIVKNEPAAEQALAQEKPAATLANSAPATVSDPAPTPENDIEYEKRMIEIEQEKIRLKRQDLELRKQQLELESGN